MHPDAFFPTGRLAAHDRGPRPDERFPFPVRSAHHVDAHRIGATLRALAVGAWWRGDASHDRLPDARKQLFAAWFIGGDLAEEIARPDIAGYHAPLSWHVAAPTSRPIGHRWSGSAATDDRPGNRRDRMTGNDERRFEGIDAYGLVGAPPERTLDAIVADAAESAAAPISMISVVDRERQWFAAATGIDHRETALADSICAHAIRSDGTFVVSDLSADPRFRDMIPVREDGIRFYAGAPLVMRDGVRLGTLCVVDLVPRDGLDDKEQQALEVLARRAVAAIELRRDLREGASGTRDALIAEAAAHLVAARAALDLAACTAPLAHLEQVIVLLEDGRGEPR